jgi:hypothetical protein
VNSRQNAKAKTVDDLRKRLQKCVTEADREKVIKTLVADSLSKSFRIRHEARTLLLAYLYGEPSQRQHVSLVSLQQVTHK